MSILVTALKYIRREIPIEILNAVVMKEVPQELLNTTSVDGFFLSKVIREMCIYDANIIGGIERLIPLQGVHPVIDHYNNAVFKIPKELTMNRLIVSVMGVGNAVLPGPGGYMAGGVVGNGYAQNGMSGCGSSQNYLQGQWSRVRNSEMTAPLSYNASATIIGPNTILVQGLDFYMGLNIALRCVIANEEDMNNIQPRNAAAFAHWAVLAAKYFIYTKMNIYINSGVLQSGKELGVFGEIIQSYSQAGEDYYNYFNEVWGKVSIMNDTESYESYLRKVININF